MTAMLPIARSGAGLRVAAGWRAHLVALAAVAAAILLLFRSDVADMAAIWWNASTFNHCLLIPPIIAWMVRQRLPELRRLEPAAWAPGLFILAAGALAWLIGEAGSAAVARHLGLVLMLQGAVVACLGKAVARGLAFPIFYALFLVPAGEELVPPMQVVTAYMCMGLLALVGIPAHLEGIFITIPTGYFEVAEACAGVKFLIAMIAFGALVSNLCFRSWRRRAAFMAAAVAIPILANGIRAWGTIYISHLTTNDFAASFDHVVYGWFFFAAVLALLLGAGWRFFDRPADAPFFDPDRISEPGGSALRLGAVAAAALAMAAMPPAWSAAVEASADPVASSPRLPAVPGWRQVGPSAWSPHYAGADGFASARYRDPQGREVDLAIAAYARQSEGRELVGFGQGPVAPEGEWVWIADAPPPPGARAMRIAGPGGTRDVVTFYRVGDVLTGSANRVKLETARARLLGGAQRAVAVTVSAEGKGGHDAVDRFLSALGDVGALADDAAGLPRT